MTRSFLDGREERASLGAKWLLDPKQLIDGEIAAGRPWEPQTTAAVRRHVKPGWTCLDVGANIGYYTVLLAQIVGPAGRVLGLEPMAEPCSVAQRNCALNGLAHAEVRQIAASDTDGENTFSFGYSWCQSDPCTIRESVALERRLDTLVQEVGIARVDAIKIDVDGYEMRCLRGARDLLTRDHPTLFLEVCDYTLRQTAGEPPCQRPLPDYGRHALDMLTWLVGLGYDVEEETGGKVSPSQVVEQTDLSRYSTNVVVRRP